ncbi:peptidylprolyl isomerase [Desulfovibrio psychrotolerans]|uniref:peptidylprolyl isomerase n=1 Tax=Desulfovibrio psychrotolerans TaxID=415242 RepID=A0A7J0BPD1_9BACT|nr:peptidylprolyl isomerase [Desulfovibrio psychrotolerans]GFM35563.1 hypothetical protein DSM19430T_02470 [Desulfovibrio psychrotolerans]
MSIWKRLAVVLAVWAAMLAGCGNDSVQDGVVATVNGKPIYLKQLEARYDLDNLSWSGGMVPSVDVLRSEYGQVLSQLIVHELVIQALDRAGLGITDEDVAKAEAVVREDYPEDQFEKSLVEEYIDIEEWRSMLRQRLAMERLKSDILRPRVKLTSQEAETYYREHLADFYLPPRVRFLQITGPDRRQVEKARESYLRQQDIEAVQNTFDEITIREMRMRLNMLPVGWESAIGKLKPGQASTVSSGDNGFETLVLLEHMPEKVLDPSRAYPLVETVLIEQKMRVAFEEWLVDELGRSEVKVTRLLRQMEEQAAEAEQKAQ